MVFQTFQPVYIVAKDLEVITLYPTIHYYLTYLLFCVPLFEKVEHALNYFIIMFFGNMSTT